MSSLPAPLSDTLLPEYSEEHAAYVAPMPSGPRMVLSNRRAFRNPVKYLPEDAPEVLICDGVPEAVPAGVQAVGRLPQCSTVRAIEWRWRGPLEGDEHLLVNFLAAPGFAHLDTLWLHGAPLEDGGVKPRSGRFLADLQQKDRLPRKHLHLAGLSVDMPAIKALRAFEHFAGLESLRLTWATGGRRWNRFLGTIPEDAALRFVEVSWSDLGDTGLSALLDRPLPNLERLVLRHAGLTDEGAKALLRWSGTDRLTWVDLSGNDFSDELLYALRRRLKDSLRFEPDAH